MARDNNFIQAESDIVVSTSAPGVALPTSLPTAVSGSGLNLPTGWYDLGLLADAGVSEGHNYNENKIYDASGSLARIIRNQEERPWTFECLQQDAVVSGLMYPGSTVTTSGATAESQTITISGSPTGGTFTPSLSGFPAVPAQTYNVPTATLQSTLQSVWDLAVTVTGTAGTSYVVAFPAAEGNVAQMSVSNALTGGTTPSAAVSTTTPGVTGINSRTIGSGTARNFRQFCIDIFDGTTVERNILPQGEAVWTGSVTASSSAAKIAQFTCNPFKYDGVNYYIKLDNLPGMGLTFA